MRWSRRCASARAGNAVRMVDWWINANGVTLLSTAATCVFALEWERMYRLAAPTLTGKTRALARLNVTVARLVIGINVAIFGLALALIQVARELDRASSAAHPLRVPPYVVQGTVAFTCIWVAACGGAWWFRLAMDRIMAMPETQPIHALRRDESRREG